MRQRPVPLLFALAILGASAFASDLPQMWRAWRYSSPVETHLSQDAPAEIVLSPSVLSHSENRLADLRLIDAQGAEIPYVLYSRHEIPLPQNSETAQIRETSFVPGKFTQVIIELPATNVFRDTIKIETPEQDFMNWVEVAASDDTHLWRVVKDRAPISRFMREDLAGNQTIRFSQNTARYLRLRIFETSRPFKITGASVLALAKTDPDFAFLTPSFSRNEDNSSASHKTSQFTADLSAQNLPIAQISFATPQPEFYRAVRILTSEDGREWQSISGGEIYRYKSGNKLEESLAIPLYEVWGARHWRIEILNGSDAPLPSLGVSFAYANRRVFFQFVQGQAYRLLYGNSKAGAPQYDVQHTFAHKDKGPAIFVSLGPEEPTLNYDDGRPFSERHPSLLWIALGIAILLLAYSALRAMRTPAPPSSPA